MPQSSSRYADEGTLAHTLCAAYVEHHLGKIDTEQFEQVREGCRANDLWDDDIDTHSRAYRDYISAQLLNSDTIFADVEISGLSLEPWVPKAFGTADFVSFDGDVLNVCDFKYGKGVAVSPDNNPQLMLYALGVLARYNLTQAPIDIHLHIIQPRISEPRQWSLTAAQLLDWANNEVAPKAQRAIKGEGEHRPSAETCRFCRAKPICKGLAEDIFASVKPQSSVDALTLDEVAENLVKGRLVAGWVKAMEEYLQGAMLKGKEVQGWKLVEGRSNRKICDIQKAAQQLRAAGFPDEMTHKLTLFGLTDLERLVGKKQLPVILGDTLARPTGAPTMVEESDPRPPMDPAAAILKSFDEVTF